MIRTGPAITALLALALTGPAARGAEPPARDGDVYLTYTNVDLYAKRFATEVLWVQPMFAWLDGHLGGRYAEFSGATWGHGIVGAHAWLPKGLGHLLVRYEGGAGDGPDTGHYAHHVGDVGWARPVFRDVVHLDAGLELIRVDTVDDDLARIGLAVVPMRWLVLHGGYQHSTRAAHGAEVWTARGDVTLRQTSLFAGYARSRDSFDLSSVGQGRVRGDPTDEYLVGVTLPLGRHGVTFSLSRFEGAETRHTLTLTWRWSLAAAPWSFSERP